MNDPARIVFAGSPDFAVPSLAALAAGPHTVVGVFTQPDRPAGRGRRLRQGPVKAWAIEAGLPVFQPRSLRPAAARDALAALLPDLVVVVAYGLLLPAAVLEIPRRGCVNVHASLLPRWRGAAPIQAAILAGDAATGVSLMALDAGLDTGPVYALRRTPIGPRETAGSLHDRLAGLGAALLADELDGILDGRTEPRAQPAEGVTHAGKIDKADARIDWRRPAVEIDRQIRAFNPWPVAETRLDGAQLRCWAAEPAPGATPADVAPGAIVAVDASGILVCTGAGLLRLTQVQRAGRGRVAATDFARGAALAGRRCE